MAHFARIENGTVVEVHVVSNDVVIGPDGIESETLGQEFLADLHGGEWVQTSYSGSPINGEDRGHYAGIGYSWDGKRFAPPPAPEPF